MITFDEILQTYIDYHIMQSHTDKTINNYISVLTRFQSVVQLSDYSKIDIKDIYKFSAFINSRNVSIATRANYMRHLKAFIKFLCNGSFVDDKELYKQIKVPRISKINVKIYTDSEIEEIYQVVSGSTEWLSVRNKLIISLMLDCGLRQAEVCRISLCDISGNILNVHGKGRKDRIVPIGTVTGRYISEYLALCPFSSDMLVLDRRGKPLSQNAIKLFMQRYKEKLGFEFSSHRLRHNFATNYLLDGYQRNGSIDAYSLMILLGHEDISTTDRYVHFVKSYIASQSYHSHLDSIFEK